MTPKGEYTAEAPAEVLIKVVQGEDAGIHLETNVHPWEVNWILDQAKIMILNGDAVVSEAS